MARGGRYHPIEVDAPDAEGDQAAAAIADPAEASDPTSEAYAFLPDKPLSVPAPVSPGSPPAQGPPPVPAPIDAPDGADLDLPDKPSKLADLYNQVSRSDPDRAARVLAIQKRMNAPADYIDKNLPDAEKALAAPSPADWQDIETKLPGTTQFLAQPQNMAVAHDDIPNIAHHEMLISHAGQAQTAWDAIKAGWQASALGLDLRKKLPDLTLPENAPILHSLLAQAGGIAGDLPDMIAGGYAAGPAGAFALPAAMKAGLREQIIHGDVKDLPDLVNRSGTILKEAAKQGVVGLATSYAGAAAKPLAEAAGVYLPVSGALGTVSRALTGAAPLAAESAAMEVAGKAVEGQMPSARGILENTLMVGAMHATTGTAGHYLGLAADARAANDRKNFFVALGDTAQASKLRARLPEAYQKQIANLTKNGPLENIFIEPDAFQTYFQSKGSDPDQVAAELGVGDSLAEARETGGAVKIPLSTWAGKIAGTEHYQGLADDIKFGPDQPSVREVRDAQEKAKADVAAVMERHAAEAKAASDQKQVATESPIYRGMYDQLVAAGRDHEEANAAAKLHERVISTLAERAGTTPEELASRLPVQVQATEAPADVKSPYDPSVLSAIRDEISAGEQIPGNVTRDDEGYVTGRYGSHSTFPEYFKHKGYSKEGALAAIDRAIQGQNLSDTERALVQDLYQSSGFDPNAAKGETAEPFLQRIQGDQKSYEPTDEIPDYVGRELSDRVSKVQYAPIEHVIPNESVSESAVEKMMEAMREGEPLPAIVGEFAYNEKNPDIDAVSVLDGHTRLEAAKRLGMTHVPVRMKVSADDWAQVKKNGGMTLKLFQPGETAARGRIRIGDQGSIIDLFKGSANASTPLHEFGHYYLNLLEKLAADPSAPADIQSDMKTIRDWMGLKDGEAIGEEHHEKWARAFESYLREGKAPSRALEPAFRRFKTWLTSIYRKASELRVTMSPEIRDVMSRMMASEDAVEAAREEVGFRVDDMPDVTPETRAKIRTLQEQARDIAERQLLKDQMPELKAQHKEFLAKERERLTSEAEAQVKQEPLYAAIDRLNQGSGKADAAARAGRFLKAEAGGKPVDPAFEEAAEIHGFESGKDLAWKIVDAAKEKSFEAAVKERVDEAMEAHAPLMDTAALRAKALEAIHNDKQTEYLALEREALAALVTKKLINQEVSRRKRIDASVAAAAAKEQAQQILDGKSIREATASRTYITAERNAAVKAARAMLAGDHEKAAEYKRQQMLNSALAREAMRNAEAVQKAQLLLHKYASRGADLMDMPYGFIRQIDQILSKAGMADPRTEDAGALLKTAQDMDAKGEAPDRIANATGYIQDPKTGGWRTETLSETVRRINDSYYSLTIPDSVLNAGPRDADSLTLKDLRELHDAVGSIADVGKRYDKFLSQFIKADMKVAAREIGDSIGKKIGAPYARELGPGRPDIGLQDKAERLVRKMMDGLIPSSVSMQTLAKFLDKGDDGPVHQYLYRPLKHAEDAKFARWQTMRVELEKLISDHFTPKEFAGMKDKSTEMAFTEVPGRRFNLEERLSVLLNWGNEGNRDRIRRGFEVNDEQVNRIIGSLDEKHVKFAQAVWDHLETYWPEIKALEMKVNGVEPTQVEAAPVDTQFGPLKGGYYPIAYDFEKSQDAYKLAEQKSELFKQFSAAAAHTERGHAEARAATFKRPVRLSMDVFFNHLENVVHDLEFRPAVIDTARMLNQPEVKGALEGAIGIRGAKSFSDWLKACASDQGENLTYVQKVLQWTRFRTALTSLGLRPLAIIRHLPGNIWNGMQEIGSARMLNAMRSGLTDWVSGNGELHDYVFSRSDRMANRLTAKDRDLSDMARKWTNGQKSPVIQYAFFFQHLCDEAVSLPLWHEVYNQHLAEHGESKAVDLADEAVNRALGSGSMVDRIGAQRGGQFSKLLTMNYSWMSVMMNRAWLSGKMAGLDYNQGNTGQAIATMAKAGVTLFAVPALLEVLAQEAIRNAPGGETDQERKRRMLGHALDMPFQYVLGLRDIAPPVIHAALGEHGTDYKLSPVEQALQNLLTPIGEGLHMAITPGKHPDEKFAEHTFHAAAQLTGTPQQLNTWAFNLLDDIHNSGQATWRDFMTRKAKR